MWQQQIFKLDRYNCIAGWPELSSTQRSKSALAAAAMLRIATDFDEMRIVCLVYCWSGCFWYRFCPCIWKHFHFYVVDDCEAKL